MIAAPTARRANNTATAMGLSAAAHLVVVAVLIAANQAAPPPPMQKVIIAELVARGEPKKKKELPRRIRTKVKKKAGVTTPKKRVVKTKPKAAVVPNADAALKRLETLRTEADADDALARLAAMEQTGDDPKKARGRKNGSDQGTLSEGELTTLQNSYLTQVGQAIKADGNYRISETISASERIRLKAVLFLRIGASGQLLEARMESSSGHDQFDRDILAAARSARYPAPPKEVAKRIAAGVRGTFRP